MSKRLSPGAFLLPVLIVLVYLLHALFYFIALGRDAVDDAYISFRYAQNAILGHGLVFNPGERVEGFTNFLWTTLMLPLEGAGIDVGRASILLGILCALGTMWLVTRFAKLADAPRGAGILAALLLAVDGTFALWAVSGLESALFALLVIAGAYLYIREQSASALPWSGILFALAGMTRPEGIMVFGITVLHQTAWRLVTERRLFIPRDLGRVVAFGALFVPYWLGRWAYYHSFLPNSFHAKVSVSGPEAQLERGWNHLNQFIGVHAGWLITTPPLLALAQALRSQSMAPRNTQHASRSNYLGAQRSPRVFQRDNHLITQSPNHPPSFWTTYLTALIIPYALYIVYVGGDWSVGRFFVPLLPPFYLLFSTGLIHMWKWVIARWRGLQERRLGPLGGLAALLLAAGLYWFSSWNGEYGIFIRGFDAAIATEARETMGKWLKQNAAPGTLIAVDAAGQVPYFSGLPAVDMFGINDLHIGRLPISTLGQGTPGHEKFDLIYVIQRAPRYVVIYGTLLDTVKEYERAPAVWTDNPDYMKFLTLYRLKLEVGN